MLLFLKIGDQWALDMAFDSTGQFLAIACVDGFIKVYDVRKGNLTHNYKVHSFIFNHKQ